MKRLPFQKRTLALIAILLPLLALFIHVTLRSGPLAPVSVVLATVENKSLSPSLFGIGTVEARYTYKIGPTAAGRVKVLEVQVGENVEAGQVLGEMDPVDLDERIKVQDATVKRVEAQLKEAQTRKEYAQTQTLRYEKLLEVRSTSEEELLSKKQDLRIAEAGLTATREELARVRAEREVLESQRKDLLLISPVDGLVVSRDVEPGTTVVAGQSVIELIDPSSIWVNVRFDQIRAHGLRVDLPAHIRLRSQPDLIQPGHVLRIEPLADAVTEEILAKVVFQQIPDPLPPIGELTEITLTLPTLEEAPVVPNAAIHLIDGRMGVWLVTDDALHFTPITPGIADLDGQVQVRDGLQAGDQIVVYSEHSLHNYSRIQVVENIPGVIS